MFRITLGSTLGYTADSQHFRDLITASNGYGIGKGGYKADKIEMTDLAKQILALDPAATLEILFSNPFFSKIHQRYANSGVPNTKLLDDCLKEEGVSEKQIPSIREGILQNMRDWQVIHKISGVERIVPRELALQELTKELKAHGIDYTKTASPTPKSATEPKQPKVPASSPTPRTTPAVTTPPAKPTSNTPPPPGGPAVTVSPNLQVNIEIHIAADTPHDTIEKIFESMGKHVMKNESPN